MPIREPGSGEGFDQTSWREASGEVKATAILVGSGPLFDSSGTILCVSEFKRCKFERLFEANQSPTTGWD